MGSDSVSESILYNSTQSSVYLNLEEDDEYLAEEELAAALVMADFSSPEKSDEYSNMIGFFDMSNMPTLANTPIDVNENID